MRSPSNHRIAPASRLRKNVRELFHHFPCPICMDSCPDRVRHNVCAIREVRVVAEVLNVESKTS